MVDLNVCEISIERVVVYLVDSWVLVKSGAERWHLIGGESA